MQTFCVPMLRVNRIVLEVKKGDDRKKEIKKERERREEE